ncbi:hypothetical protein NDU88_002654 [Pleurodeles waltl]|uniref:Uncharacterized protein n=1 Tax=Pleurodeles waltl TaxID=8319 RepID=A0AAV7VB57_PLEWA|nr:hypothetical protein NDU88_002654 [Pleurodeles waltl]
MPRLAILLRRMWPELLGDPEYKRDLQATLNGYFSVNWTTTRTRSIEWEALRVVIGGESLSKSCSFRNKLDWELAQQEDVLTALQHQVDNRDTSEADCCVVHGRIGALWSRLDN